jgi:hypothetical protein
MRNGVDEGIVLGIAANLSHQESCIENDAADDHREQQKTQKEQNSGVPVEDHPADVKQQDDHNEADAERNEECNRLLAARDHHDFSLALADTRGHPGPPSEIFPLSTPVGVSPSASSA